MSIPTPDLGRRRFLAGLLLIIACAGLLRGIFPAADPPWQATVGIVWHDEGAWTHNARNKALFGEWSLDAWNPMYIAPVFTALETASFHLFGVGVRQARIVPAVLGVLSVALLALGVRRIAGGHAGLAAGALLATNFVYVMWNRTAMMEGPMVAFIVIAWYCYVRAQTEAWWGWLAGICALLAFFTKAAAVFFVGAMGLDAAVVAVLALRTRSQSSPLDRARSRAAWATLGGLAAGSVVALAAFVGPNWSEYRFYNFDMSVTRKPSYDLRSLVNRVTWFPIVHDIFTRMWAVLVVGVAAGLGMLARWRDLHAGERLLLLWVGLGSLELILHDTGNERRFVFLIPAFIALAASALGRGRALLPPQAAEVPLRHALLAAPLIGFAFYMVAGAIVRLAFLYEVQPNVRLAAALAVGATAGLLATWPRIPAWLAAARWSPAAGLALALLIAAGHLGEYIQWATGRTYKNYEASLQVGARLPAGTLVHGKLANGLALENHIKPVFVGRGFGNYADRRDRDDVRYILTYLAPRIGYEGSVITDVLDAYPHHTIVMTFDVAETTSGHDRAALIDKFGAAPPREGRAQH
ncbi:MAG: glycosyltransferase family 39 protein [Acidobacteria bacterium]|nr:glycosyltransferase family 39 protein [Acidobacteriota bacterium]